MAASQAVGIVKNHPFIDGNKRIGIMVAYTFLTRNGLELEASESGAAAAVLALAAWLKINVDQDQIATYRRIKIRQYVIDVVKSNL